MPKKPTTPFGYISFSKDRKVDKKIFQLSDDKAVQEKEVAESFVTAFNKHPEHRKIIDWSALPENDQDFLLKFGNAEVLLQVTELVEREFVIPMTEEEYNAGQSTDAYLKDGGPIPWRIDIEKRDEALARIFHEG